MNAADHWAQICRGNEVERASWHQFTPTTSLDLLDRFAMTKASSLVDVGGGASTLVDHLLDRARPDLTVVDIAPQALALAQNRLGFRAAAVNWIEADITRWTPVRTFDVWHDRARVPFPY